jgi:hypothetical protein
MAAGRSEFCMSSGGRGRIRHQKVVIHRFLETKIYVCGYQISKNDLSHAWHNYLVYVKAHELATNNVVRERCV